MTYSLRLIDPSNLKNMALKLGNVANVKVISDFIILPHFIKWEEVLMYFARSDAELRRSNFSMALSFLLERELDGILIEPGLNCKPYFLKETFRINFLKLCLNDKGILSVAFTILNSLHDKSWNTQRELLINNLNIISGTKAYDILNDSHRIPSRIIERILEINLLSNDLNLRQTVHNFSPIILSKGFFEKFFLEIQRSIIEALWTKKTKRVSSGTLDSIFDYQNTPTLIFEENVKVLLLKLKSGEKSNFIDDIFDYLADKISSGKINPASLKILTENDFRELNKLAGMHSYDLIEKTSSILAEADPKNRTLIQNRIKFWSIFKDQFLSIRIFLDKSLIDEHEVFRQRKDLKRSLTYSAFVIKFEKFWFVQYLEKDPGVTYGFYFHKDNPLISQIFYSEIFSNETVMLICNHANKKTIHGPYWQNHLAQYLHSKHGFKLSPQHSYLLNPAPKPGGEFVDNDPEERL